MASVKMKFRPSKIKGHEGSLYYQVIHKRTKRQYLTSYTLFPEEWDQKLERVVCDETSPRYGHQCIVADGLQWDRFRFDRIIHDLESKKSDYTTDELMRVFRKATYDSSVFNFMELTIAQLRNMNRLRLVETYTATLKSIYTFRGGRDLPFEGFTSETMQYYQAYLKSRSVRQNTISFYMRILRATYNRAVEKGMVEQRYPFKHVYTGIDKTVKRALPLRMIKAIKEIVLPPSSPLAFARDMFMFSFYTRGMSFVDIAYLRRSDIQAGTLIYHRRKTGQRLTIRWENCMKEIAERYAGVTGDYLFSIITDEARERPQYINAQHFINRYLKILGRMLKLHLPLTLYVARHSWASVAKSRRIPISVISEGMGHDSEATTQIYLSSLETSVVDNANRRILNLLNC